MTEAQLQESLQRIADSITVLTTAVGSLVSVLINKGVITEDEYNR